VIRKWELKATVSDGFYRQNDREKALKNGSGSAVGT
jgi:predicted cupin superfamily sugar epimerase